MKKYALISVYDKTGVEKIADFLVNLGYTVLSTGGTLRHLKEKSIPCEEVSHYTDFPEMMDGRVKTLHPKIHGGILNIRENESHRKQMEENGIFPIDYVIVNLYPFFEKVNQNISFEEKIEFIDIGGPTMIRSAAKNYKDVVVCVDPDDYQVIMNENENNGRISEKTRKKLAYKVFSNMAAYDASIAEFLYEGEYGFPDFFGMSYSKKQDLRYGENPHQKAAFYQTNNGSGAMKDFTQLHGKELSYNNIKDMDSAWKLCCEFAEPAAIGVKHNIPCFAALGNDLADAFEKGISCDNMSIFGGILAFNGRVDKSLAEKVSSVFLEIIIAVDFEDDALGILGKKKNIRLIKAVPETHQKYELSSVDGGLLVQEYDSELYEKLETVTNEKPDDLMMKKLIFGWKIVKYCKSNAIVAVKDFMAAGISGGEVNRFWPAQQALSRAKANFDSIDCLASDGFFPFSDVIEEAHKYGVKAIIQPGGSVRDKDSIDFAEKHGISMVLTGMRHFKH